MKKCAICGASFDTSREHPQRLFAVICLACDEAAWDLEQKEWEKYLARRAAQR